MEVNWEDLKTNQTEAADKTYTARAKIPGGWLYRICFSVDNNEQADWHYSICFVPFTDLIPAERYKDKYFEL